jgi:hypothetical protein
VTADHGQLDVDFADRVDVAAMPTLAHGVALVAGEQRALHVYAADAAAVAARWADVLGERAIVCTRAAAVADGWFGPVADHVRPWLGDVIVATRGRLTIVDARTQSPASLAMRGVHGSLTRTEMTVPLVAF